MLKKIAFAGLAVAALSVPSLAATDFYVAKSTATKKCEVVDTKPDGKSMMDVGKKYFLTKADAEAAMKNIADCK